MLEKKSYVVKELSAEAYYELLKMLNCRDAKDLLFYEEQLLEQGLVLEVCDEEVYYDVENPEYLVSHYQIYLLDNIREKLQTVKTNKKYKTFILIKNQNNEKLELVPLTFQSMIKDKLDQEFTSFKKEIEHYTKETLLTFVI